LVSHRRRAPRRKRSRVASLVYKKDCISGFRLGRARAHPSNLFAGIHGILVLQNKKGCEVGKKKNALSLSGFHFGFLHIDLWLAGSHFLCYCFLFP
jgi:hypothetical protein